MKRVIIYGTGADSKRFYHWLTGLGISIAAFCESSPRNNMYCGIPVLSREQLEGTDEIIISVRNRAVSHEIKMSLIQMGIREWHISDFSSFYMNNMLVDETELGGERYCPICENAINDFLPGGETKSELFKRFHVSGGGDRKGVICPACGSNDRERWIQYVLIQKTKIFDGQEKRILHIAPERYIEKAIRSHSECDYYTGDIIPFRSDHIIDITHIPYEDSMFDYLIINHVMEHIYDEEKAFTEIKRVMKKNGVLIISFPICFELDTQDGRGDKMTDQDRLNMYGQVDHVRLYGRDYAQRMKNNGFSTISYKPIDEFTQEECVKYGYTEDDVVIVGKGIYE